jgi:hypothetical protein
VRQPGSGELFLLPDPPLTGTRPEEIGIEPAGVAGAVKTVDAANKRITIDTTGATAEVAFTVSYPVVPGRGRDVFAEAQLTIDDTLLRNSLDSGAPRVFQVPFAAPVTKWCYYLITDRPEAAEAFLIVDATPGGTPRQVVFSDAGRADLSRQPDMSDPVAADLKRRHPGKRILRFVSDGQIACRKTPVTNLELQVGGSWLFASLPNPSPRCRAMLPAAGPEPDQRATVFFQTITLVTS